MKSTLSVVFLIASIYCFAQDEKVPVSYILVKNDDTVILGTVVEKDDKYVIFNSNSQGYLSIPLDQVREIKKIRTEDVSSQVNNAILTLYFLSPNSLSIGDELSGYYQNTWVLFNQFVVGKKNFSIGLGTIPSFLFGADSNPIWITPRVSIPVKQEKLTLGAGGVLGTVLGQRESLFGVAYGTATLGNKSKNFTFGLGWGYSSDGFANSPTLSFSGLLKVSRRTYLMTENYYFDMGDFKVLTILAGARSIIGRVSLDYGLLIPREFNEYEEASYFALPWLSLAVPLFK